MTWEWIDTIGFIIWLLVLLIGIIYLGKKKNRKRKFSIMNNQKLFIIKSNAEFHAIDLDDAFDKLVKHFNNVKKSKETNLIHKGEIHIELKK